MFILLGPTSICMRVAGANRQYIYVYCRRIYRVSVLAKKSNILAEWADEKPARHAKRCKTCSESALLRARLCCSFL